MQTENLPTEELKKFGIINEDLSFFKKTESGRHPKISAGLHHRRRQRQEQGNLPTHGKQHPTESHLSGAG